MALFNDMTLTYKIKPNTLTFNSLINVCAEKRDLKKALELVSIMRQYRVPSTTSTFNSLYYMCAKTGDIAKGMEILQMMKTLDIPPDNRTFTALISACRTKHDSDDETNDQRSDKVSSPSFFT